MITIIRQGVNGTAVVNVPTADLTTPDADLAKVEAKRLAVAFMSVNSTWIGGKVFATRATLAADGKSYSVAVKHVVPRPRPTTVAEMNDIVADRSRY